MPLAWAASGTRLELPIAVEFRANGELAVIGVGDFLGEWLEPQDVPTFVQFFPVLQLLLPKGPDTFLRPTITGGQWSLAEDKSGRLVQFYLETSGFSRGDLWLPRGQIRFRAKAYGAILAQGSDATVTIRESRAFFGAFFGAFAGLTMGPAAMAACALAAGFALNRVAIVVGNWTPERLDDPEDGEDEKVLLSPVKLTADDPSQWR